MKDTYIVKLAAEGSVLRREPFDKANSLKQLQRAVGGYIERAPAILPKELGDIDCFVDEEGLLKDRKVVNECVSIMCCNPQIVILGDAVFAGHDGEGETVGLTEKQCGMLEEVLVWLGATKEGGKNEEA